MPAGQPHRTNGPAGACRPAGCPCAVLHCCCPCAAAAAAALRPRPLPQPWRLAALWRGRRRGSRKRLVLAAPAVLPTESTALPLAACKLGGGGGITAGKWMLYTSSDAEEAVVWTAVARAVYVEVSAGLCMLRAAGWGRQAGAGRQADRLQRHWGF